ncbi:hypothetical protein [Paenibacillus elgii]|uniref:hypothetical protein n=1 Tax=Paenibacillus elgii TaxID=189691 RepID=UPI0030DD7169
MAANQQHLPPAALEIGFFMNFLCGKNPISKAARKLQVFRKGKLHRKHMLRQILCSPPTATNKNHFKRKS